jgi:hypothetical protein
MIDSMASVHVFLVFIILLLFFFFFFAQYFNAGCLFTLLAFCVAVAMIPLRPLFLTYVDQHWAGEMELVFASMSLAQAQTYVSASIAIFVSLTILISIVMVQYPSYFLALLYARNYWYTVLRVNFFTRMMTTFCRLFHWCLLARSSCLMRLRSSRFYGRICLSRFVVTMFCLHFDR